MVAVPILEDTITAIATPIGEGGLGVIRISGASSLAIAKELFKPISKKPVKKIPSFSASLGNIVDPYTNEVIDEIILTIFRSPKSYTKEDMVEFSCHGGIVVLKRVLELIIKKGAKLAAPGEFTKRAFLNGRIDLAQAEAVADIIRAKTDLSLKLSVKQLTGSLSKEVNILRNNLKEIIANLESRIDFSEEDIEAFDLKRIQHKCEKIVSHISKLIESAKEGEIIRTGISAVIIGKPNTGKSSLLNSLLDEERAIVTSIPGTTRDTIEGIINIEGIAVKLIDTAGIRESKNPIEQIGIKRTKNAIEEADIIICIFDGSESLTKEDEKICSNLIHKKTIGIVNKSDLKRKIDLKKVKKLLPNSSIIIISALKKQGLDELKEKIAKISLSGKTEISDAVIVTNIRHRKALEQTVKSMKLALESIKQNMSEELICLDLRNSLNYLGEIVGETTTEDILATIFSSFCIGK